MASSEERTRSSENRTRAAGRRLWLGLPVAVLLVAAGSSPAITQRVPRFAFPVLAALGGALVLLSFARSLVRSVRGYRADGRLRALPVVVNALAAVFLAVLPLTRALGVVRSPATATPRVLVGFGDWLGGEGYPRGSPHRGVDFKAPLGADVLAAAGGLVTVARDSAGLCGLIVVIRHDPHGYRTVYCHSSAIAVRPGDVVTRGQRIGAVGTSGQRAWPGFEHVHLELQRGTNVEAVEDPLPRTVGCFDAAARYPTDRLVLTYPLRC